MNDCPFCDFAEPVERDYGQVIVFKPLNPVTAGHLLVVPREHVTDFADDPEITAMTARVAATEAARGGDMNLITSKGGAATQTVWHLHFHLVPRHAGDGLALPWSETHGLRRGHLADLEVVEALLLSDPRTRASGYDASPRRMAQAVRAMIDNPELHNPGSYTPLSAKQTELREAVEAVLFDWVGKQTKPMPRSLEEWGPVCHGCGNDEFRIDGFCSVNCRDRYEFALEIRQALSDEGRVAPE